MQLRYLIHLSYKIFEALFYQLISRATQVVALADPTLKPPLIFIHTCQDQHFLFFCFSFGKILVKRKNILSFRRMKL